MQPCTGARPRASTLFPAMLLCACAAAAADAPADPAAATDQVTVTGRRITPTAPDIAKARAEAARVAGGSNVIGAADYADGRASTLLDVFALAPGVFVQPRFGSEEARLSIRGSGLQRTFHLRGINLLQDGVPITLADGSADFQAIEPLALAYTQVMRGGNALQYGGTTLGGSINFVSPSGITAAGPRLRSEGGSHGYWRALAGFGGSTAAADFALSVSATAQDGYRRWSEQQNERLFGNAGFALSDAIETRFYAAAVHSDSQLPGALTRAQLRADPRQANAGSLSGRQKRDFDLYRVANRTVFELGGRQIEASVGYSYKDLWHPIFQLLQQRSGDYSAGLRYVDDRDVAGSANRFIAGVARSWNRVDDDRFVNVAGNRGARTGDSVQHSRNLIAYLQDELSVTERLTAIAGLQWTQAGRRNDDRFLSNGDQGLDADYNRASPRLGLLWQGAGVAVFGNVSDSFEPPSFGELAGGPGVNLLQAQTARTVEIGTRGESGRVRWDITAYTASVHNELLALNSPDGQPLGTVNAPRTRHRGVEFGADLTIATGITLKSALLWNDFHFDDNASYGNNALPGVPPQFYRGELAWQATPRLSAAITTEWAPRRYAVDMARTLFSDGYATVGVKVAGRAGPAFNWFVEARNLANRNYVASTGVIADARGLDSAQFYAGDGRAVYAGIDWRPEALPGR
ncbi:MAG TPA: TonB-dependent receptor [Steroidobacteraceae bacterium]|jgi:iron complex outermembrane receptor protein|nr:TonB-dependent receptor [Steroidobacteraceae bacterium]